MTAKPEEGNLSKKISHALMRSENPDDARLGVRVFLDKAIDECLEILVKKFPPEKCVEIILSILQQEANNPNLEKELTARAYFLKDENL